MAACHAVVLQITAELPDGVEEVLPTTTMLSDLCVLLIHVLQGCLWMCSEQVKPPVDLFKAIFEDDDSDEEEEDEVTWVELGVVGMLLETNVQSSELGT